MAQWALVVLLVTQMAMRSSSQVDEQPNKVGAGLLLW
jgi:hypothetical protein